jgi:hypothetical protein
MPDFTPKHLLLASFSGVGNILKDSGFFRYIDSTIFAARCFKGNGILDLTIF